MIPVIGPADPKAKAAVAEKTAKPVEKVLDATAPQREKALQKTKEGMEKVAHLVEAPFHKTAPDDKDAPAEEPKKEG